MNTICPKCGRYTYVDDWGGTGLPPMCDCRNETPTKVGVEEILVKLDIILREIRELKLRIK